MIVERFAAEHHGVVHDRFLASLEGRGEVLEFLIDIRETFGDIGSLDLVGVDTLINEDVEKSYNPPP